MRLSEVKVLALLRYRENHSKYASILKDDFFSIAETKDLFRFIGTYHAKYGNKKNSKVPMSYLRIAAEDIEDEGRRGLVNEIIDQLAIKNRGDDFVEGMIRKFGQRALLKKGVFEAFDLLQGKEDTLDLGKIKKRIEDAMAVITPVQKKVSFFDDVEDQIEAEDTAPRVPTGIRELDNHMRGGMYRGGEGLIVAPPKKGKTAALINIGKGGLLRGRRVIHFTLEISKRVTTVRYAASIARKSFEYMKENMDEVKEVMEKARKRKGELFIEEIMGYKPTVADIEGIIRSYPDPFDVVIVDYLDLCRSEENLYDERARANDIYQAFRRMAQRLDVAGWSASQSNRASMTKKIIGPEDVAEDIRKIATCDIGVFICQTPEEKEDDLARLFIGATRFGDRNPIFPIIFEAGNSYMKDLRRGE